MPHPKKPARKILSKRTLLVIVLSVLLLLTGAGIGVWKYLEYRHTQEEKQYLTIKEWGVRFKLPEELQGKVGREDIEVYPTVDEHKGWEQVHIYDQTPSRAYKRCEPGDPSTNSLGLKLIRVKTSMTLENFTYEGTLDDLVTIINGYAYGVYPYYINDSCFINKTELSTAKQRDARLFEAAKAVEAAK